MTEWRECKLGDVIVLNYGKALPEKKRVFGNIPVYSSAGLTGYHNESLVNGRGIIIGRKGTIGSVHFSYKPFWCIDTAYYITDNEEYNLKYIYYLLQTLGLNELNEDSAVPGLNRNTAYQQDISFPPLPEQKAIAEFLSSLDDKIDLLTRQNKTLEDLAQTYFRKWFVEDSSDDWDVGKAEDYFEIGIGKTPPRKEHKWFTNNPNDKVWISIADMGKSGLFIGDSSEYLTSEAVERFNIRRVPKGSILLSFKLTVGRVAVALCELTTNEAIAHFKYKEAIYREYLYCYLKSFDYNSLGSTSSIATAINSTIIKEMPFVMPDKCKLTKFHELTAPIFRKIETNILQMTTLQKLRDTLLPKLISGEVRVKQ